MNEPDFGPQGVLHSEAHGTLKIIDVVMRPTSIAEDPKQREMWVQIKLRYVDPLGFTYEYGMQPSDVDKWIRIDGKTQPAITWGKVFGTPFTGAGRIPSIPHDIECKRAAAMALMPGGSARSRVLRRKADENFKNMRILCCAKPSKAQVVVSRFMFWAVRFGALNLRRA